MNTVKLNIILHENQKLIHQNKAKYKAIKAGKRFGKTKWAIFEVIKKACEHANKVIWYVAPTYGQAESIAWDELKYLLPKELIKRKLEQKLLVELINGSTIQLKGADNEDSLRGKALFGVVMDEVAYVKENVWPAILSGQLLNAGEGSFAYFISSPNSKGKNWYSAFWDKAKDLEKAGDKEWAAFYFTIFDNPTINRHEIEKMRERTTDDTWNLEYMAIESDYAGILISEFDYKLHVGERTLENTFTYVRGIDWGIDHPTTCLWVAIDEINAEVYIYDEFVKSGFVISESCDVIKSRTDRPIVWSVIDPSTNKRNSQTGRTDKDEFARYGVPCVAGDNRDRGLDITKMFFKKNKIKIHPKCKNLINEIRIYQRGDKTGDDCIDPMRYVLVRVHDYMFGGRNVFDDGVKSVIPEQGKISLYDQRLFPIKNQVQDLSWMWEEVA